MYPLDFVDRFEKPSLNAFDEARYLSIHGRSGRYPRRTPRKRSRALYALRPDGRQGLLAS
jgi:hypothetical protein